jgi:hypothetical protein
LRHQWFILIASFLGASLSGVVGKFLQGLRFLILSQLQNISFAISWYLQTVVGDTLGLTQNGQWAVPLSL